MCDQVESIQKVLEDPVLRVKEVHSVRWLSFFMALETVYRTIDSLITFFQSRPVSDAKAAGLKKKVGQELFLRILYGMMDWLQPIMTLSQFFQRKGVDISVVKTNVNSCLRDLESMKDSDRCAGYYRQLEVELVDGVFKGQHQVAKNATHFESVKNRFLQAMIDNVRPRFPETEMLSKFCVLGMKPLQFMLDKELELWGNNGVADIAKFYCEEQQHKDPEGVETTSGPFLQCTPDDIVTEWVKCKDMVKSNKYSTHSLSAVWTALAKLQEEGSLQFPNLSKLLSVVLTHPVHTADCERAFSTQNMIQTQRRNRLSAERCDQLMRVGIEGGELKDFDFKAAVKLWSKPNRRIFHTH